MARARLATRPSRMLPRRGLIAPALLSTVLCLAALASPTPTGASVGDQSPSPSCGPYVHHRGTAGCDGERGSSTTTTSSPTTSTNPPETEPPETAPPETAPPETAPPETAPLDTEPPRGEPAETTTTSSTTTTTTTTIAPTPAPEASDGPGAPSSGHQPQRGVRPWPRVGQPVGSPPPSPAPLVSEVAPRREPAGDRRPAVAAARSAPTTTPSTARTTSPPSSPIAPTVGGSDDTVSIVVSAPPAATPPVADRADGEQLVDAPSRAPRPAPTISDAPHSSSGIGAEWSALMASTVAALLGAWYAFRKRPPVVAGAPGLAPLQSE